MLYVDLDAIAAMDLGDGATDDPHVLGAMFVLPDGQPVVAVRGSLSVLKRIRIGVRLLRDLRRGFVVSYWVERPPARGTFAVNALARSSA